MSSITERVAKTLITVFRDAEKTKTRSMDEAVQHRMRQNVYYNLSDKGKSRLEKIITILKKHYDEKDDKVSRKFLEYRIHESLRNLLIETSKNNLDYSTLFQLAIDQSNQIISLIEGELSDYYLVTPLENLHLDIDEFQFGNLSIKKYTRPDWESNGYPEKTIKIFDKHLENFRGKNVIETNSKAFDREKAIELMKNQIDDFIKILKFYRLHDYQSMMRDSMDFNIEGKIHKSTSQFYFASPINHNKIIIEKSREGYLRPFTINADFVKLITSWGSENLVEIVIKKENQRTSFEKRILSSILIAGSYDLAASKPDHYLKLIIALEAILLDEKEPKNENLAERVALLTADNLEDRKFAYELMKGLYRVRNNIVHQGLVEIDLNDLVQLQYFTQATLINLLKRYKEMKIESIKDLKNWILDIKFEEKK